MEFLKLIYNLINKYINVIIILLFLLLLLFNKITYIRLCYFIIIIMFIIIYKYLYKTINKNNIVLKDWIKFCLDFINENTYNWIILGLVRLSILNNVILYIIPYVEILVFNIIKKINYYINNEIFRNVLILILVNLTSPLKIIISKFYRMLNMFNTLTVYEILFKRMYGLIFSVLIFTDIINMLIMMCNGRLNLFIYIYVILLIISIIESLNYTYKIKKILNVEINYNEILNLIITNKNLIIVWKFRSTVSIVQNFIYLLLKLNFNKDKFLIKYNKKFNLEYIEFFNYIYHDKELGNVYIDIKNFKNWYNFQKIEILNDKIHHGENNGLLNATKYIKTNLMLYNYYFKLIFLLDGLVEILSEIYYIKHQKYYKNYNIKELNFIIQVYTRIIKILIYIISYIEESVGILAPGLLLNKIYINNDLYCDLYTMFFISFEEFYKNSQINNKNEFFDLDKNWEFYEVLYVLGHLEETKYMIFEESFEFINLVFKSELAYAEPSGSIRNSRYGSCFSTDEINILVKNDLLKFLDDLKIKYNNSNNKGNLIRSLLFELKALKIAA